MRPTEYGTATLWLPRRLRRRLIAAARAARPREACGALVGTTTTAGRGRVVDILPLANRAEDGRRSYRVDPAELEPVLRTGEVLGFYHSHPDSGATFSATDARLAWPAWWYVVIGTDGEEPHLTAWRDGRRGRLREGDRHEGRSGRRGGGRRRGRRWPS